MTAIGEHYLSASILVIAITDDPAAEGGLMDDRDVRRMAATVFVPSGPPTEAVPSQEA